MEDVVSKRCGFVDASGVQCNKHPSFGHAGELRTVSLCQLLSLVSKIWMIGDRKRTGCQIQVAQ